MTATPETKMKTKAELKQATETDARAAAWAAYAKIRAAALVEYEKLRDAAWAEYNKKIKEINDE